jgi:uncharacterized protein YyaL (SSP411 family)
MVLLKLSALTGDFRYSDKAEETLRGMQQNAAKHPSAFAEWLNAIDFAIGPQLQVALVGDPQSEGHQEMLDVIHCEFRPNLVVAADRGEKTEFPALLKERPLLEGKPTAYLCQNFSCRLPTNSPESFRKQLADVLVKD